MLNDLKEFRLKKNLTQREVADKLNISESMICLFEHGLRRPNLKIVQAYAQILGVDVKKILDCFKK